MFSILLITSCGDSSVNSELSVEDEINMGSPYRNITISFRGESPPARFGSGDGVTNYEEAYAEDGFFIIRIRSTNRILYNLETVIDVQIEPGSSLSLTY